MPGTRRKAHFTTGRNFTSPGSGNPRLGARKRATRVLPGPPVFWIFVPITRSTSEPRWDIGASRKGMLFLARPRGVEWVGYDYPRVAIALLEPPQAPARVSKYMREAFHVDRARRSATGPRGSHVCNFAVLGFRFPLCTARMRPKKSSILCILQMSVKNQT